MRPVQGQGGLRGEVGEMGRGSVNKTRGLDGSRVVFVCALSFWVRVGSSTPSKPRGAPEAERFLVEKPEFGGHFVLFFWMCFELF